MTWRPQATPNARPTPVSPVTDAALRPRPVWGSERAYVLTTIAGIVGLGNLWRFPYMAGRHGGGSFLVAYVICVLAVAVPLAALESAAGSVGRRSPVGSFRRAAGRPGAALGWAVIAMAVTILSYYLVVTGWTLGYAVDAARLGLRTFDEFVSGYTSLWYFLLVGLACLVVLLRGVAAIERASLVLVPVLVAVVVGLAAFGQTLDGAGEARDFTLGVSGARLADPATWQAAAGQAFYSVGVGQGVLIAYGSFVPAGTNLVRSTTVVAVVNALVSMTAAAMVFAVVFSFGIPPTTGSELSFTAFPRAFAEVPGGSVVAVLFFTLLLLAGLTSCLGAFVVIVTTVRDELGLGRRAAARLTVAVVVLLGIPSALSFTDAGLSLGGEPVLDRVDQATGSGVIVILGLAGAAVLARGLPRRVLSAAFNADAIRVLGVRLSPNTVIRWATVLPLLAFTLYVIGVVLTD